MYTIRRIESLAYRFVARLVAKVGLLEQVFLKPVSPVPKGVALHVLFLCKGNICRSPYAAERFTRVLRQSAQTRINVSSAGLETTEGKTADANAIRIAAERGMDLTAHRTRIADREMLATANVIFVMEPIHRKQIKSILPEALGKVMYLGAFNIASGGGVIIADPYGKPDSFFHGSFNDIDSAMEEFVRVLVEQEVEEK